VRKKRKFTQEKLAEALGVSFQAISKWETAPLWGKCWIAAKTRYVDENSAVIFRKS